MLIFIKSTLFKVTVSREKVVQLRPWGYGWQYIVFKFFLISCSIATIYNCLQSLCKTSLWFSSICCSPQANLVCCCCSQQPASVLFSYCSLLTNTVWPASLLCPAYCNTGLLCTKNRLPNGSVEHLFLGPCPFKYSIRTYKLHIAIKNVPKSMKSSLKL